ncbi:MAG TPA: hypothetical protein VK928_06460 [Longimicrobiales bacterium]|nr:hypothetical protein [Longimicrobiales bacterium]
MRILIAALLLACTAAPAPGQAAPWVLAGASARSDNQPRTALRTWLEYGRYVTPAATAGVTLAAQHLSGDDVAASTTLEPGLRGTLGIAQLRTGLRAGASLLFGAEATTALGFAAASVDAGSGVSVRARVQRDRYAATLAAIDTLVLEDRVEVALDRAAAPGWAGELVARRDSYGDDNPVTTLYGWLLAPLSRSARHGVRLGYSVARQDATESRWSADPFRRGRGPAATADSINGRYDPYYTPHDAVTHSVLAEVALLAGATWLRLDASLGVHASDIAPTLQRANPGADPTVLFYERTFTPYSARASSYTPLGAGTSLTVSLDVARTAYYRDSGVSITLAHSPASR